MMIVVLPAPPLVDATVNMLAAMMLPRGTANRRS
jgi:hypothetical protein